MISSLAFLSSLLKPIYGIQLIHMLFFKPPDRFYHFPITRTRAHIKNTPFHRTISLLHQNG